MIYLQLDVYRDTCLGVFNPESAIAELMIHSESPEEATRSAINFLRKAGWRAQTVNAAHQGHAAADFGSDWHLHRLFEEAEREGVACVITTPELAETATTWRVAPAV